MRDCLFCKIIAKKIPSKIEFENDSLIAIQDINPQAPTHLLVIPKKHIARISEAEAGEESLIGSLILTAKQLAKDKEISEGFRLVFNNGAPAGQTVFHIHLHLLGGRVMTWPPG